MPQVFNIPSKIVITCPKRITPYLEQEVESLGFRVQESIQTGVVLKGTIQDCITLNLHLRCAHQVLYALKAFKAKDQSELYARVHELPWETWIDPRGYFSVTSHVLNDTIRTPLYANLRVKDAIVDRIKAQHGIRPDSGPDLSKTVVHLHWVEQHAEIFLDTSGLTLSKHGYRKMPWKAPLQESLASALIYASSWNENSPFINPMCGSGTLAIEAALLATGRHPGLQRMNYAFMHILGYDPELFYAERRNLKAKVQKSCPKIIATDISPEAIKIAQQNAKTAGVDQYIEFQTLDFAQTSIPEEKGGVVMINPEYGQRLGDASVLEGLYTRMGDFFKQQCPGYTGYILTANPQLAKVIGLKSARKIPFYNGKLDCRLIEFELYAGTRRDTEG